MCRFCNQCGNEIRGYVFIAATYLYEKENARSATTDAYSNHDFITHVTGERSADGKKWVELTPSIPICVNCVTRLRYLFPRCISTELKHFWRMPQGSVAQLFLCMLSHDAVLLNCSTGNTSWTNAGLFSFILQARSGDSGRVFHIFLAQFLFTLRPCISLTGPSPIGIFVLGPTALPFCFCDVESFGRSLVNGRKSGCPGMYFRSTSGTRIP